MFGSLHDNALSSTIRLIIVFGSFSVSDPGNDLRHLRNWHISEALDAAAAGCLRFQDGSRWWVYRVLVTSRPKREANLAGLPPWRNAGMVAGRGRMQ